MEVEAIRSRTREALRERVRQGRLAGGACYGYDRVRFIRPVHIGDTITVKATIAEKRDHPKKPDHGYMVEQIEVFNQEGNIVLACQHLYLVQRKEDAAPSG